ncbi:MAG: diacylglycerol kinase family lipid kinase [Thomasclavelia sp.]|nr:diacylglycerol kinase family lipid kinase [Thomasclavelia sp.]
MSKALFIINPSSGKEIIQEKLDKIIGQLVLEEIVNHIDVFYTSKKNDAYNKAKEVDDNIYDYIISVGGDGTLNEVASGMVDSNKKTPLVILAAGTVNDFANYLGIPNDITGIVNLIKNNHIITSDIGKINDNYFINVAAGGMFADISFVVSKEDKKKFGPLAYYFNGLVNLSSQLRTDLKLSIKVDDHEYKDVDSYLFAVTNTNRVGGFDDIMPYADITDGKLDIAIIKKCSVTDLLALIKDFRFGKHSDSPFVIFDQGSNIEITCSNNDTLKIDVDGEEGCNFPVKITNIHNAINIIIP